jgi:nitroimidazol reductase NimA-like FMN-containing flavoprotein (pyridoxamine 5'-phosphate oxidase superfamily)
MTDTTDPEPGGTAADSSQRPDSKLLELDRAECLRLLAEGDVGRIAVTVPDWPQPVIRPVNYVFDQSSQSVLIRSGVGSKLHAVICAARAAFEIDGIDPVGRAGWSVIIHGVCEEITNPAELKRIDGLGLEPWAPGHKGQWIRIRANTVSGRRIVA